MTVRTRWAKGLIVSLLGLAAVAFQTGAVNAGGTINPNPCTIGGNPCGLGIEKLVNGEDADTAPGELVPVGSIVTFTYLVTATSGATFLGLGVLDDNGTPGVPGDDFLPSFVGGDVSNLGVLDPGETWTYTAQETALVGLHTNIGAVGGLIGLCSLPGPVCQFSVNPVLDQDPASYTGVVPSPASIVLVGCALSGLVALRRLRSRLRSY